MMRRSVLLAALLAIVTQLPTRSQEATRLTVDLIWSARYLATSNPNLPVIENGALAILGNRIVAIGTSDEVNARYIANTHLQQPDAILAPGLINTHTHAGMSLLRGIANDLKLEDWLQKYIFPVEANNVDEEFVRWGTRLAMLEMMLSGTTTYTDMYYFEDAVAEETRKAGMRGVLGQTVIGFPAPDYKTPQEALTGTRAYLQKWANDPLITPAVAPHSIYTTSDDVLQQSRKLADEFHEPMLIHLAETKAEYDESKQKRGKTPTEAMLGLDLFGGRAVAAHAVWVDDTDLDILQAYDVGIAHNPSSNMMLASGIAPVTKMLGRGIDVGLGTDGPAGSNNDFDMMEEMDTASKLQKVATGDPAAISAAQVFAMATLMGARVLGMESTIGSLEAGKLADVISVDLTAPHAQPLPFRPEEVYASLVYALKESDVTDVMVNGKWIVTARKPLTLDPALIRRKAEEYREKIAASLAK